MPGSLLGHYQSQQAGIRLIMRKHETLERPTRIGTREQIGTCAKTYAISAKPLFIGSIPIAASKSYSYFTSGRPVDRSVLYHTCITTLLDSRALTA
jgi:hypothetical protein